MGKAGLEARRFIEEMPKNINPKKEDWSGIRDPVFLGRIPKKREWEGGIKTLFIFGKNV